MVGQQTVYQRERGKEISSVQIANVLPKSNNTQ
jgi:hypothetical protein